MNILDQLYAEINKNLGALPNQIKEQEITRFDIKKPSDKLGWVRLNVWSYNGKEYAQAFYGDWSIHSNTDFLTWSSWTKDEELQSPGLVKEVKLNRTQVDLELKKEAEELLFKIQEKFKSFTKASLDNEYIVRKKMHSCENLFHNSKSNLVLPVYNNIDRKEILGFQTVTKLNKKFEKGTIAKSGFNYFGKINSETETIYLCEGIATADTIYYATKVPTVSCFSAGNILNVAEYFKHEFNGINIVIACDIDKNRASIIQALKAQKKYPDILIVKPNFEKESKLSDFNDLYVSQGIEETRLQLHFDETLFTKIEMLGHDQGAYFFYSTKTKEIMSFSVDKMKAGNLISLAEHPYWATRFVAKLDKEGIKTNRADWLLTTEKIVSRQNKIGKFSGEKIKGLGSWIDRGHHVLNLGNKLLVNFKPRNFGKHKDLSYFYQPNERDNIKFEPKKEFDFTPLNKSINLIDFSSDRDRIIVLGYIALSQIFTTQRWRPNIWITADKGTGKSSLLEFLTALIQNSNRYQGSTAAGLRQDIQCDSKVCIIDEAEGEDQKTKQLIELARQSSSGSGTRVARGTVTGKGFSFTPELSFVFASIRIGELTPADKSRIAQVFMKNPGKNDIARNERRESSIYDASLLSTDLFSYMNLNLEMFNELTIIAKNKIREAGKDNRTADQLAPLLSGAAMLNPELDISQAITVLLNESESSDEQSTDQFDFYDSFLNLILKDGTHEISIEQILSECLENPVYLKSLLNRYGMEFKPDRGLFVSKNNNLDRLFKLQTKFKNYFDQMNNSKYFTKDRQKISRSTKYGYFLS